MDIGVVIVTYNRLEMLKGTLDCLSKQTKLPFYIILVDNASTDGTKEFTKEWSEKPEPFKKYLIRSETNTGGSGGFYMGEELAVTLDADWIYCSDDDAFPEPDALEKASAFLENNADSLNQISVIKPMIYSYGKIDLTHCRRVKKLGFIPVFIKAGKAKYKRKSFQAHVVSYVAPIINKKILKEAGLIKKDYIIWCDDEEHFYRLSKYGKILCVPDIKIHHDVTHANIGYDWKYFYGVRNKLDWYKEHFGYVSYIYCKVQTLGVTFVRCLLHPAKAPQILKIVLDAFKAEKEGKFGLVDAYKPGWKIVF